jgi:hypothetical protein
VFPHVLETSGRIQMIAGGGTFYTQCDDLGNALALSDASGNVIERYEYDDFGLPHFLTSDGVEMTDSGGLPVTASPAGNRYLFCGMEWESETGLYFSTDPYVETTMRCYDPRSGRYFQSPQTEKRSTFAENNPWSAKTAPIGKKQKAWLCANYTFNGRTGVGGHGGGGSGGCGIAIDESGVHFASGIAIDEQGVHFASGIAIDESGVHLAVWHDVRSPRDSHSGQASGRQANVYAMYSVQKGCRSARDSSSGMATGRRSYSAGHFMLGIDCARDSSSGMATGRRSYSAGHFDLGQCVATAREASSGMATGRRSYNFFEAWPCRWTAPELNAMSTSRKKEFKGHITLMK